MPQLEKGGKWVFGWCVVGSNGKIQIPPEAFIEYGFKAGALCEVTKGSQKSGGFAICKPENLMNSPVKLRTIGNTVIDANKQFSLNSVVHFDEGQRLLAARGSGIGLSFLQFGPIVFAAEKHPELEVYHV